MYVFDVLYMRCHQILLKNAGKKYYPQILLEECKYAVKDKNIINSINEKLNLNESDESVGKK